MPSAMTSPSALSWFGATAVVMSAVMLPTTRLASGATATRYLSAISLAAGSTHAGLRTKAGGVVPGTVCQVPSAFCTPFLTIALLAEADTNLPVEVLSVKSTSVTRRPKEPALVTRVDSPAESGRLQTYGWWVWPLMTTP